MQPGVQIRAFSGHPRPDPMTFDHFDRLLGFASAGRAVALAAGLGALPAAPPEPRRPAEVKAKGAELRPRIGAHGLVIRRGPADERTNCFGFVFVHGRYWVPDTAIDPILTDNGYHPVSDPHPGDVAVYRDATT